MWALVLGRGGFEPPKALGQLIYSQSRLTASVSARPRDFTDNPQRWAHGAGSCGRLDRCRPRVVALDEPAPQPPPDARARRDEISHRRLGALSLARRRAPRAIV